MIGVYNYTVWLTYISLFSAVCGSIISLSNTGHPYLGVFFLLICGLCDAFDGKVARIKKDRSIMERNFGIQIDSLSDVVAFGVLPACIGAAMIRVSPQLREIGINDPKPSIVVLALKLLLYGILVLYVLAAMIRLAYFNVTEEERQKTEDGARKYYVGLPVTSAALIFPTVLLVQYIVPIDITLIYFCVTAIVGVLFLAKFHVRKPGLRGILIMTAIGAVEFVVMIIFRYLLDLQR